VGAARGSGLLPGVGELWGGVGMIHAAGGGAGGGGCGGGRRRGGDEA